MIAIIFHRYFRSRKTVAIKSGYTVIVNINNNNNNNNNSIANWYANQIWRSRTWSSGGTIIMNVRGIA